MPSSTAQPSAFLHLQTPTEKLALKPCQNQILKDCCHQSQAVETAEGCNTLHVLVPTFKCVISRTGNVVSIFCHLSELGVSEGQPQAPTYPCLERVPTQGLWFAFYCLLVGEQRHEGKEKIQPHIRFSFPTGPPKLYTARDFSFQLHASSLAFYIII